MSAGRVTRRMFLADLGRATVAVAILAGPACRPGRRESGTTTPVTEMPRPATTPGAPATSAPADAGRPAAMAYRRVSLGFVSAYVLARAGEAVVVDTGVEGSGPQIEGALGALGLGWEGVGHVILTHRHADHVGGLAEVLGRAEAATGYAGEADIPRIGSPRPLEPVGDGDQVFGLRIIATPGHTAGHVSVLDPVGGVLVVGDALNGADGGVAGPNPQFTNDMATAVESVRKLAGFEFQTLLFGHGEPVEGGADREVAELAAEL